MTESAYAHHTILPATSRPARRADAGTARLSQRDIDGPLARTSWIMTGMVIRELPAAAFTPEQPR